MSSANSAKLKYIEETVFATTPAAALQLIPATNIGLNATINTTQSAQISSTRATLDTVRTDGSSGGDIGFEAQYGTYDAFWEGAFASDFLAGQTLTATDISAAAGDNSFNSVAAAFDTAQITPGTIIKVSGFVATANNTLWEVVSCTTAKIIVTGGTVTTEAAGASVTIKAKDLRDGSTRKSYSLEVEYSDHSPVNYSAYVGQVVSSASLTSATGSIVNGSFTFSGTEATHSTSTIGTGADLSILSNEVFSPTGSIGTIFKGGSALTGVCVSSIGLTINANTRPNTCLGSLFPANVVLGGFSAQLDLNLYFNEITYLNDFINGTETSLRWSYTDTSGNTVCFYAPRIKANTATIDNIADDQDIMQTIQFEVLYDTTLGFALQMSTFAA
jgi:hypothetical protein